MNRLIGATLIGLSVAGCATTQNPTTATELSHKLANGRFDTAYDAAGNLAECKVTRSTGDPDLDRGFCEIARACARQDDHSPGTHIGSSCMDREQAKIFARIVAQRNGTSTPR